MATFSVFPMPLPSLNQLKNNVLAYSAAVSAAGRKGSVWTQAFLSKEQNGVT